jgi:thioredoxin reductase (NADPH)
MDEIKNKVTIIGAGPAGIAAAIYLKRAYLNPIVIEKDVPGGLLRKAYLVENYPGFPSGINGNKLVGRFIKHLHGIGISITKSEVKHLSYDKDEFLIETDKYHFFSSAVIIASGTKPRTLDISGAASINGSRLFYDPHILSQLENKIRKRIVIIGGGDIAFDYALTCLSFGYKITIIARSEPTCLSILLKRVINKKVYVHTNCIPKQISEDTNDIIINCQKNGTPIEIKTDYIIVAIGRDPNMSFLSNGLKKYIDDNYNISKPPFPGLFLAGDVVRKKYRQTGIAVGDGIYAAMMIERYFNHNKVKR